MTETIEQTWSTRLDAPVVGGGRLEDRIFFALGDGTVRFAEPSRPEMAVLQLHSGAILDICPAGPHVVSCGDDGCVVLSNPDGSMATIWQEPGHWVDCVAASEDGEAIAWTSGKRAFLFRSGTITNVPMPSTPSGLTFDPRGRRIAIAHYGGISLWQAKAKENLIRRLEWAGSHIGVNWSPNGRYVLSAMQENELHGWRLADGEQMRMAGYTIKPRSISWDHSGKWLATSGADAVVIWPFFGGGPWNRAPLEVPLQSSAVTRVAFHPHEPFLAVGHSNGSIMIVEITSGGEGDIKVLRPADNDEICTLTWAGDGKAIGFGTAKGTIGVTSIPMFNL